MNGLIKAFVSIRSNIYPFVLEEVLSLCNILLQQNCFLGASRKLHEPDSNH